MSAPTAPRRRRALHRLLALAGSLLVALLLGEIVVRVVIGAPMAERLPVLRVRAHRTRGWEMLPSELHYTYLHPVRMNALGLRGDEVPEAKDGELRVLALGDSLIYGQGVADAETVPAALEAGLRARDPRGRAWRVINAGHRGYATNQEVALLRELGARIAPDVVLLCWYPNDLADPDVTLLAERLERSGPVAFDTKSKLEGLELLAWRANQVLRRSALLMYVYDVLGAAAGAPLEAQAADAGFARLERHMDELIELCDALGARLLVAILPESGAVVGAHPTDALYPRVAALARARSIELVELEPTLAALRAELGRTPILLYDGHYDARANRALGDALVEPVLQLVDGAAPGR